MTISERKQIALIVETSLGSGREILRGIAKYAHQISSWELRHEPRSLVEALPQWLNDWQGDGVIARIRDVTMLKELQKLELPVVDVLGECDRRGFPLVHVDDVRIAQEAAAHFLDRGF